MKQQNFDQLADECDRTGQKWQDPLFGPDRRSLCHDDMWDEKGGAYADLDWLRAGKIPSLTDDEGDLQLFVNDPDPNDIQ